jgi:hypothetical protein
MNLDTEAIGQLWIVRNADQVFCVSKAAYQPSIGDAIIADGFVSTDLQSILVNAMVAWSIEIVANEIDEDPLPALGPADDDSPQVSVHDVFGGIAIRHNSFGEAVETLKAGRKVEVKVSQQPTTTTHSRDRHRHHPRKTKQ